MGWRGGGVREKCHHTWCLGLSRAGERVGSVVCLSDVAACNPFLCFLCIPGLEVS